MMYSKTVGCGHFLICFLGLNRYRALNCRFFSCMDEPAPLKNCESLILNTDA